MDVKLGMGLHVRVRPLAILEMLKAEHWRTQK